MKIKVKIKEKEIRKMLDILFNYPKHFNGAIIIDSEFYRHLNMFSEAKVHQLLNLMSDKELINVTKAPYPSQYPTLRLTPKAFSYTYDLKNQNFRFWVPVIVSVFALIIAIISLVIDISTLPPQKEKQQQITPTESTNTFHNKVPSFPLPPIP